MAGGQVLKRPKSLYEIPVRIHGKGAVALGEEVRAWMDEHHIKNNDYRFYFDTVAQASFKVYGFNDRDAAMLFKLRWGGQ